MKSPKWVVNKRATINPKNGDNKCFQYLITVALHNQDIENHVHFLKQYNAIFQH